MPEPEEVEELSPAERRKEALIRDALAARGIRYRYGGTSRGGFDCSGFTRWLMLRNLGIKLPHSARAQARLGQKVVPGTLKPGDLVFFKTNRRGISHVGMYIGNNRFIHAPRTGRSVSVDSLTGYYKRRYVTARRLKGLIPSDAPKALPLDEPVAAGVSADKTKEAAQLPPETSGPGQGSPG
jgi:cell wall-associated NlpC family hydrolase